MTFLGTLIKKDILRKRSVFSFHSVKNLASYNTETETEADKLNGIGNEIPRNKIISRRISAQRFASKNRTHVVIKRLCII